jgi:hypothetical protein
VGARAFHLSDKFPYIVHRYPRIGKIVQHFLPGRVRKKATMTTAWRYFAANVHEISARSCIFGKALSVPGPSRKRL